MKIRCLIRNLCVLEAENPQQTCCRVCYRMATPFSLSSISLTLLLCPIITVANCAEFLVYERINVIGCAKIVVSHMNTRASTHPDSTRVWAECVYKLYRASDSLPVIASVCLSIYECVCVRVCVWECTLQFASVAQRIENCAWAQAKRVIIDYAEPRTVESEEVRQSEASPAELSLALAASQERLQELGRSSSSNRNCWQLANKLLLLLCCCCCGCCGCCYCCLSVVAVVASALCYRVRSYYDDGDDDDAGNGKSPGRVTQSDNTWH